MANKYPQFSKINEAHEYLTNKAKHHWTVFASCSRKRKFDTEDQAENFHENQKLEYSNVALQYPYRCKHCLYWHLASIKDRTQKS